MKKSLIVEIIASLFFLLFVYTAISKILTYKTFEWDLGRDPLLEHYSKFIAVAVPAVELLVSVCLILPRFRKIGLWSSFGLMVIFTGYIGYVLKYMDDVRHCTCGGFIRQMSWNQHLWFNSTLVVVALIGSILSNNIDSNDLSLKHFSPTTK